MKKYTFNLNNDNTTGFNTTFCNSFYTKSTDYSKILDDLIFDDLMDKNPWLSQYTKNNIDAINIINTQQIANTDDDFIKAFTFLKNYNTNNIGKYFIKDKYYELSDGTLFCISDNYIYMNGKFHWFDDMKKKNFYTLFTPAEKKTICTIYTDSLKITIKA